MSLLSDAKRRLVTTRIYFIAERIASEGVLRRAVRRSTAARTGPKHILLAAPGGGSVGDQAMFEAFVQGVSGEVVVIVRQPDTLLRMREDFRSRVTVLVLPDLLYGSSRRYFRVLRELADHVSSSTSFSVVGADVMDGAYSSRASARRFWLAAFAAGLGLSSRVLGFSWNAEPTPLSADAARWSSRRVSLLARDPKSSERLRALGADNVADVADLAFLAPTDGELPDAISQWIRLQRSLDRRIVILNANYLLEKRIDQVEVFTELVRQRSQQGISFVLLPHDSRSAPSDETLVAGIASAAGDQEHVFLVEKILMPGEVVELASQCDFVITGRMHLAILSAIGGTPAIAISYQGKIEGLYRNLGLSCFLSPDERFVTSLNEMIDEVSGTLPAVRASLSAHLPGMKALAGQNFAGLARVTAGE